MPLRLCRLCLLAATVTATAWAQTATPATGTSRTPAAGAPRPPATKSASKSTKPGKTGVPDPDLLDGSAFDKEKRPMEGMLSEIEMGEKEGPKGAKVSPDSGPGGSQSQPPDKNQASMPAGGGAQSADAQQQAAGGAASDQAQSQQQGGGSPAAQGPAAEAQGTQVANLKVPEGAQSAVGAQSSAPRNLQIGDASLQIPGEKNSKDVVGVESSTAQQYDKKTPGGGQQSNSRNQGVEKGRVIPKGL